MSVLQCAQCGTSVIMQKAPTFHNKLWLVPSHHGPCERYLCVGSSKDGPTCPVGPLHDCFGCQLEAKKSTTPYTKEFFAKIKEKYE